MADGTPRGLPGLQDGALWSMPANHNGGTGMQDTGLPSQGVLCDTLEDWGSLALETARMALEGGGAAAQPPQVGGKPNLSDGTSLFVCNLSRRTLATDIRRRFEEYGAIVDVYLPRDYHSGEARGFGFVEFEDAASAEEARRHLDGLALDGRTISVDVATDGRKHARDMRMRSAGRPADGAGGRARRTQPRHTLAAAAMPARESPSPVAGQSAEGVLYLTCGGTIDKDYPRSTKGYAFEFGPEPAAARVLRRVDVAGAVAPLMAKDSLEMDDADRQAIAEAVLAAPERRVVVTHGTDTLVESALYVDRALGGPRDRVLVFTGSARPERFRDSDADFNLGAATAAAHALGPGVYVCMNGVPRHCSAVRRDPSTGRFVGDVRVMHAGPPSGNGGGH